MLNNHYPIGIFDSGIGGFSVLKEVHSLMPDEDIIYFGDTARVPYGSKSKDTVIKYSQEILTFLLKQNVKYIVVACNTASSYALESLKEKTSVPIMGVIESGVHALIRELGDSRTAALIATSGTIRSKSYELSLQKKKSDVIIQSKACPLFVPLVEENLIDHKITEQAIRFYLNDFDTKNLKHIILGCTHYPLLKDAIMRVYPDFQLIDSSREASITLKSELIRQDLLTNKTTKGTIKILVSDSVESFNETKNIFLKDEDYTIQRGLLDTV